MGLDWERVRGCVALFFFFAFQSEKKDRVTLSAPVTAQSLLDNPRT